MRAAFAACLLVLAGCSADAEPRTAPPTTSPVSPRTPPARWDPRDVDKLPAATDEVAPGLPAEVDPPDAAPLLEEEPMDAAVLSVDRRGGRIQLLGSDGSWREVRVQNDHGRLALSRLALSPDGTSLAALVDDGIELWYLPTGRRTRLSLPSGFRPWDFSWVDWIDGSTLLLDDAAGSWRIDVGSGDAQRTRALRHGSGRSARRLDLPGIGHLQGVAVRGEVVIGTTYDDRGFAVVAFDRSTPSTPTRLPVKDFEGNYSNWALRAVEVLDDGSGLFWVAVPGRAAKDGWRLVRWTPGSDLLEIVTTSESDPTWPLTLARDLVAPRTWNPRKVDDLPPAPDDLVPGLPAVLDVPSSTTALADDPVEAAVLTVEKRGALQLLGTDGRWRHVPLRSRSGSVELTRDGTRLLVGTEVSVDVWDLGTATRRSVPVPDGHQRSDFVVWQWLDDRTLLLDGSWRIDAETGDAVQGRVPEGPYVVDDAGEIYEFEWGGPMTLLQVRGDTVAGIGWSDRTQSLAVTVADRADGSIRDVLAVQDDGQTTYGNGGLSVQALLADGTVLLRVLLHPADPEIRFVAWQPETDDLSLVMRTGGVLPGWSVATDLLD
jgi:hypothetical protein